jgi:hypothetical protein
MIILLKIQLFTNYSIFTQTFNILFDETLSLLYLLCKVLFVRSKNYRKIDKDIVTSTERHDY